MCTWRAARDPEHTLLRFHLLPCRRCSFHVKKGLEGFLFFSLQTVTLHCLEGTLLSHHSVYHSAYQSLATLNLKSFPRDRRQGLWLAQGLRVTVQV